MMDSLLREILVLFPLGHLELYLFLRYRGLALKVPFEREADEILQHVYPAS